VSIGSGLEALGQGVDAIAEQLATAKGEQDGSKPQFQLGPDGKPQLIQPDNFIMGRAGQAYLHAYTAGSLAVGQNSVNETTNDLRARFKDDPQGFAQAVGAQSDALKQTYPGSLGIALAQHSADLGSRYFIGMTEAQRTQVEQNGFAAARQRATDIGNLVENSAAQYTTDSPAFLKDPTDVTGKAALEYKNWLQVLVDNPRSNFTQEEADSAYNSLIQRSQDAWAIGRVKSIRDMPGGGIDKAAEWLQNNVAGPGSIIPLAQRQGLYNQGVAQLQSLTESQQAQKNASQADVQAIMQKAATGQNAVTPAEWDATINKARESYNAEGASQLQTWRLAADTHKPFMALSPTAAASAIMGPQPQAAAAQAQTFFTSRGWTPEQAAGIVGNLIHESGGKLDPNARAKGDGSDGSDSIGIGQWNQDRATALQQFAASKGKPWNDYQTQLEFVDHELNGSEALAGGMIRSAKDVQGATGAMLGYERPQGYKAGGNPEAALGWQSRLNYANAVMGDGAAAGPNSPVPYTQQELRDHPGLLAASYRIAQSDQTKNNNYFRQQAQIISEGIPVGVMPSVDHMARLKQIAMSNPDELAPTWAKIEAQVQAHPLAVVAAGMPDGGASFLSAVDERARTSGDLGAIEFSKAAHAQVTGLQRQLADDPHGYAARADVRWTSPVTPLQAIADPSMIAPANPGNSVLSTGSDPTKFGAAPVPPTTPTGALQSVITTRRDSAFQIAQRTGQDPASLLYSKGDVAQLTDALQRSDGQAAGMLLRGLAGNLKPDEMAALAANPDFSGAVVGLTRSGDVDKTTAAFSFLDAQRQDNRPAFLKNYPGVETRLQQYQSDLAYKTPEETVKRLNQADDPAAAAAMETRGKAADKELESITADRVLRKIAPGALGGWIPFTGPGAPVSNDMNASSDAMRAEWANQYRDLRANGLDQAGADAGATERLRKVWSPSDTNGGRLMRFAPEAFYPKDATGSQKYIGQQLAQDVQDTTKAHGIDLAPNAEHALVADQTTEQDIANHRPPSYKVVLTDVDGRAHLLEQRPGVALRFRADASDILPGGGADQARMLRRAQSAQNMGMGPQ
jgi:hypothetical protein